ncbi:MAG: ATP-binding protein [Gammaproteobacteria bacterium]|nr:ATP-binding protein [Gammaproteobacteria bacterium]
MPNTTADTTTASDNKHAVTHQNNGYITLWSLRVLLQLNIFDRFVDRYGGFENAEVLQSIGLYDFYHSDSEIQRHPPQRQALLKQLSARLKLLSKKSQASVQDDIFSSSIGLLKKSLTLTKADIELLRFAASAPLSTGFGYILEIIGELNYSQTKHALAIILNIPHADIERSLNPDSILLSSGLLYITAGEGHIARLHGRLDLPNGIKQALSKEHKTDASMLQCFFRDSPRARLGKKDFEHMQQDFELIQSYLSSVFLKKTRGVNILIYGDPGTGKTEFVRTLCAVNKFTLFEITMQDTYGAPISGADRFATLQLSQKLIASKKRCVLLFDEIEDVFPNAEFNMFGQAIVTNNKKSWINNLLEDNPIPTVWISNTVNQIDSSYLRRFDYVLKLRPLTNAVRLRIIKKYLRHFPVRAEWLSQLAEQEYLVPALVERAAKVVNHLDQSNPTQLEHTLENIIGNTLEVMGLPKGIRKKALHNTQYRLEYLNPDANLSDLCTGLARHPEARICLYGPSGTGKTAFAHYLAKELNKPVLLKRASDILSKWVGEAEHNIANMFYQATHEGMIILLDEADSFLQERSAARQSWEVTQVNELLVQMESFSGIFIASTNLMDSLDAASTRRFDFKIKFNYMLPEQAWKMFMQVLQEHRQNTHKDLQSFKHAINKLDKLTPGDFATIIRQTTSLGQTITPAVLLDGLIKEYQAKPNVSRSIGFM